MHAGAPRLLLALARARRLLQRQRRALEARVRQPHLDVLGAVQQALVQHAHALPVALADLKVNVRLQQGRGGGSKA